MQRPTLIPSRSARWCAALLATLGIALAACGGGRPADDSGASSTARPGDDVVLDGELVVFAAASLTEAFTAIGDAFMAAHPDVTVTFNFAASSELAGQLTAGAPADVFASADMKNMSAVVDAGVAIGDPIEFTTNTMVIVVGSGNPRGVTSLADLSASDLTVVLCAEEVPCGRYARQMLDLAGVSVSPRSFEQNVKGVLSKVRLGEADAGIVYRTDVLATDGVEGIGVPDDVAITATYPAVATSDRAVARAFVEFLGSPQAAAILTQFGFGTP